MNENEKAIAEIMKKTHMKYDSESECHSCEYISLPKNREALSDCDRDCAKYNVPLMFYDGFLKCNKCFIETCPDFYEQLATALDAAGYRKQSETVKEFAGKLLSPLIKAYNQSYKASGYDMEAARSASEIKHYIDYIKQTAEQFGKGN